MSRGFATDQATSPNCPTRVPPFMGMGDYIRGAPLMISLARLRQERSALTGEDNDWFSSQFWEFSQSSIVRIQSGQADRMDRPSPSGKGEGVRRSIKLCDPEAYGQCKVPRLCLVMEDGCLVTTVSWEPSS